MSGEENLAERSRIRKQVKKVLKPLNEQRNDFTGCAIVILPVVAAFVGALQLDFSGWGASGISFVVLIIFAAIFGSRDEKQKAAAADKSLDQFDRDFPHGELDRLVAIDVLKQMAATEKYDFKEDASRLLQELGIEALPEQSADAAVDDALDALEDKPRQTTPSEPEKSNTATISPPPSAAKQKPSHTPSASTPQSPPPSAAARRRNRHIPLEPEDPES